MQIVDANEWNFDGNKEADSDGESILSDTSDDSQATANIISVATARVSTVTPESPVGMVVNVAIQETLPNIRNVKRKPQED
jgi:hypothetical protein